MVRVLSIVLVAALFSPHQIFAGEIYTWREAVQEAKLNHPDLISAHEEIKQSEADKDIVKSDFFPQLDADLSAAKSKQGSSDSSKSYSYGASASQLLFDGFKTSSDVKGANQNLIATQYSYLVTSSNVRLRLRRAFVDLLQAQELLKISEEIATRRKDSLDLVQLRYEAGREHKGSLLTAQANLAEAQLDVRAASRSITLAQRSLNKELGRLQFLELSVNGEFIVTEEQRQAPNVEELAETTPFLRELMARSEAAKYGVSSAKADYLPAVFADGDIGRSDSQWPPQEEGWSAGFRVSLPLFDGGARRANVKRARSSFTQAEADERSGKDGILLTLQETWANLQNSIDNIEVQKKFLEAAQMRAKISEAQYSNGLISFDDWIIIEDTLVSTKKSFLQAQANALNAEADWVQAKGGTLDNEN